MNRRDTLRALLALGVAPFLAGAQQAGKVPLVALFPLGSPDDTTNVRLLDALKQGLRDLGYIEGQNIRFETFWLEGKSPRVRGQDVVAANPDVIFVPNSYAARAALQATKTIPIVGAAIDPLGQGFVKNLAHPEGNLTGLSSFGADLTAKRMELLRALMPDLSKVAVLANPWNVAYATLLKNHETAAQTLGFTLLVTEARNAKEIDEAFARMARENVRAVTMMFDVVFFGQRRQIAALALQHRIASMHFFGEMVEAGGLMSYGQNLADHYRQAAPYVDKLLRGARPGDLPIQQSIKLEFVVNVKTAKALRVAIPPSLLLRADRVIE